MALHLKPQLPRVPRIRPPERLPDQAQKASAASKPLPEERDVAGIVVRLIFLAVLVQQSWFFLTESNLVTIGSTGYAFHYVHLVFHEAGHAVLFWAPRLLMVMGGTMGQLLMPLVLTLSFWFKQRNAFGAAVCLWWLGDSMVDCAPYINDSRAMQLQLLGGGTGNDQEGHDWNYILGALHGLPYDVYIARGVLLAGRTVMVAALLWGFVWVVWQGVPSSGRRERS